MIMFVRRGSLLLLAAVLVLGLFVSVFGYGSRTASVTVNPDAVIIDAGHGSPDGGAVGIGGAIEKDINLSVAFLVRDGLESQGIPVVMTRESDSGIFSQDSKTIREKKRSDLANRRTLINSGAGGVFVSIHMNTFPDASQSGSHVFFAGTDNAELLAEKIYSQFKKHEITARVPQKVPSAVYIMKSVTIPAVLVECGFLSNRAEEKKLQDSVYQQKLADAIVGGVIDFLRREKSDGASGAPNNTEVTE